MRLKLTEESHDRSRVINFNYIREATQSVDDDDDDDLNSSSSSSTTSSSNNSNSSINSSGSSSISRLNEESCNLSCDSRRVSTMDSHCVDKRRRLQKKKDVSFGLERCALIICIICALISASSTTNHRFPFKENRNNSNSNSNNLNNNHNADSDSAIITDGSIHAPLHPKQPSYSPRNNSTYRKSSTISHRPHPVTHRLHPNHQHNPDRPQYKSQTLHQHQPNHSHLHSTKHRVHKTSHNSNNRHNSRIVQPLSTIIPVEQKILNDSSLYDSTTEQAPITFKCNDCLAIPVLSMVGREKMNAGFIVRPSGKHTQSDITLKRNLLAPNSQYYENHYHQHQQTQQQYYSQNQYQYQQPMRVEQGYSRGSPFEPKPDEKCLMTGVLTLCDEISSYPEEVILHRIEISRKALKKSYFNLDSLFSDERDFLSDPFETSTPFEKNSSPTPPFNMNLTTKPETESSYKYVPSEQDNLSTNYGVQPAVGPANPYPSHYNDNEPQPPLDYYNEKGSGSKWRHNRQVVSDEFLRLVEQRAISLSPASDRILTDSTGMKREFNEREQKVKHVSQLNFPQNLLQTNGKHEHLLSLPPQVSILSPQPSPPLPLPPPPTSEDEAGLLANISLIKLADRLLGLGEKLRSLAQSEQQQREMSSSGSSETEEKESKILDGGVKHLEKIKKEEHPDDTSAGASSLPLHIKSYAGPSINTKSSNSNSKVSTLATAVKSNTTQLIAGNRKSSPDSMPLEATHPQPLRRRLRRQASSMENSGILTSTRQQQSGGGVVESESLPLITDTDEESGGDAGVGGESGNVSTNPVPTRADTSTEEEPFVSSASPSNSGDISSENISPLEGAFEPICRSRSIYISPKAALNDKKQWKYVVNAPERNPQIRQIVRVDICENPFGPCSSQVTLPFGFTSQCKQKYSKKKLLALDSENGQLEVDTFFIPSCCVCQLIRQRTVDSVPTEDSNFTPTSPLTDEGAS